MKENYMLRKAQAEDLPHMLAMVADAQAFMRAQGLNQWQNGYPSKTALEADIAAGQAWLLCAGNKMATGEAPVAMATLRFGPEPDYNVIYGGAWGTKELYAAIHRMAVAGTARGGGVAAQMLARLEALCRGRVSGIRIDTHRDNRPMRRLLEKCGYTQRGVIILGAGAGAGGEAGDERLAFDKPIE